LRRSGVIRETAPGKVYIDLVRYHAAEEARRKLWPLALLVAVVIALAATFFYTGFSLTPRPISTP
jgi:hypothetical protein